MKKFNNKSIQLLMFLGLFGFSIGLFDNYRELWMGANNLNPLTISRVISISSIITVLVLLFFSFKVSTDKLKDGITISLVLKMLTSTILICLNNTNKYVLIKFLMFFDIAFTEVILSSIYPLMMSINKSDVLYTKKDVVENLSNKLGFFIISVMLGKSMFSLTIDYNISFLLSNIFTFIAFIVFINTDIKSNKNHNNINLKELFLYFKKNKHFILFLNSNLLSSFVWSIILGMPLLILTQILGFNPSNASYLVLTLGILSNILAILIVKYFRFKNDHINLIFKNGIRIILYFLVFIFNNKMILLITIIYLLITDVTYGFILNGYYINKIDEKYSMFLVILKYCTTLIGKAIGIFICGILFNYSIKYFGLFSLIIGIIHYIISTILINKKKSLN